MHRLVGVTLVTLLLAAAPAGPASAAPNVRMWQTKDKHVTEGFVDVAASPAELYAAITDYARWPALFSDIEWATVKSGGREDAVLQAKSRTYGTRAPYVKFRNQPRKVVHFSLRDGPLGVKLWAQITFEANGQAGQTRVRIRMHISIGGVLGWVTTDAKIRWYRERKVRRDLVDIGKRWAPPPKPRADGG